MIYIFTVAIAAGSSSLTAILGDVIQRTACITTFVSFLSATITEFKSDFFSLQHLVISIDITKNIYSLLNFIHR